MTKFKTYEKYDERYYTERVKYYPKKHMIKYIKFLLRDKPHIKWLDIGCGLGYVVKEALDEGIDAYGIDISEYAVENSIVKNRVKYGSITKIPFEDETFDVVSAFDVIEHVHPRNTETAISELHRVLKPKGVLILTTPHPCTGLNWTYDLTHINVKPPKYWKKLLSSMGFKVKVKYVPSFLKYYIAHKVNFRIPIPDKIAFYFEEPARYIIGNVFAQKERIYILARKIKVRH